MVRLPEIPYVTDFANRVSIWDIRRILVPSPASLTDFVTSTGWDTVNFIYSTSGVVGEFFARIAQINEIDRKSVSERKALEVWEACINKHVPAQRLPE